MTVIVVTKSRTVKKGFAPAERSRTYSVEFVEPDATRDAIARAVSIPDSFLYLDVAGMDLRTLKRRLTRLRTVIPYRYGIIDADAGVSDVAQVFHTAGSDYIGKELLESGLSTARLRRVVEYRPTLVEQKTGGHVPEHKRHRVVPSGADWSGVHDGQEYTFVMLYAGIDNPADFARTLSEDFLIAMRRGFSTMLEKAFAEHAARIWMWKEDEGLLLMPFDGRKIDAMVAALRLVLNRVPVNADEFPQFGELSWRMALHLGNTTYRGNGRTGAIVSESVNFLFHLGAQFVEPGGLAVTAPCHPFVPGGIQPLLNHRGEFESVHIYTLRDLL